jgi:hypothetical protein
MNTLQQWNCCPEFIEIRDRDRLIRLMKRNDLYAIRGTVSKRDAERVTMRLEGDDISILSGTPSSELASKLELLPVYAATRDSTPAVATKRIFLRLDEDATIESVRDDIEALELIVDEVPAHAPHCAWLEPRSGRVDDALSKIEPLRALPRAANAEPQLLRPRAWKNAT